MTRDLAVTLEEANAALEEIRELARQWRNAPKACPGCGHYSIAVENCAGAINEVFWRVLASAT